MNSYKIITNCNIYGTFIFHASANTAFDAAEKAESKLKWRYQEQVIKHTVIILDGSKKESIFKKIN
jgi:hypothetical protein